MHSCLYEGTIRHRRYAPVRHEFQYRLFLVYLDLAELAPLFGRHGLWSTRGPAIARFRREDHLGAPDRPLDNCVRDLVEARLGRRPAGPIRLLTSFRYFGFAMNPLSLYYCFDARDRGVDSIVAEVNNTPWNEQHCYVLDPGDPNPAGAMTSVVPKAFHVSPFLKMDMDYHWRLTRPGERLTVHIEHRSPAGRPFDATLLLERRPLTRGSLARVLLQYPALTLQVWLKIYWQALRLWLKNVPIVPHPASRPGTVQSPVMECCKHRVTNP